MDRQMDVERQVWMDACMYVGIQMYEGQDRYGWMYRHVQMYVGRVGMQMWMYRYVCVQGCTVYLYETSIEQETGVFIGNVLFGLCSH